jgi:hypothetical protein
LTATAVTEAEVVALMHDTFANATPPLERTAAVFDRWMYLPDRTPLYVVLATVAANMLTGSPVWLLLVGPPGSGKSELLASTTQLECVHAVATLTEAALLSGAPGREKASDATGGLLCTIGDFGIVLAKDFGSVLNMHTDTRAQLLAGLREVYDGSWTRLVGTDGGRRLHWDGKVGFLGGCTESIDRHHAVTAAMGERFVYLRMPQANPAEQAMRAMSHAGTDGRMRDELAAAVASLFAGGLPAKPQLLTLADREQLVALSVFTVRARSAVERDRASREIENVPEPEAPARLAIVLHQLTQGLDAIGLNRDSSWPIVRQVALDSIPRLRFRLLVTLDEHDELNTTEAAEYVDYPTTTTRRALEDLAAHQLTAKRSGGAGKPDVWALTEWARDHILEIGGLPAKPDPDESGSVPATPDPLIPICTHTKGIAGKVESQ